MKRVHRDDVPDRERLAEYVAGEGVDVPVEKILEVFRVLNEWVMSDCHGKQKRANILFGPDAFMENLSLIETEAAFKAGRLEGERVGERAGLEVKRAREAAFKEKGSDLAEALVEFLSDGEGEINWDGYDYD